MGVLEVVAVAFVFLFITFVALDLDRRARGETWRGEPDKADDLERIMEFDWDKNQDLLTGSIERIKKHDKR